MSRRKMRTILVLFAVGLCLCAAYQAGRAFASAAEKGLSRDEARKLIAGVAGLELKKDAVNVTEVSTFGSSATAVAQVETAFRFNQDGRGKWRVAEIRTGDRQWEDVELLRRALDREKTARARAELEALTSALESFRRERGFYVVAQGGSALNDHLHPRYLLSLIRFDPWHRPYEYEGERARFTLRSPGPDGKAGTADDVIVNRG
ncbi:MAG: type II secretion system protein GspG [Pyrinomonadaceae bacterium]